MALRNLVWTAAATIVISSPLVAAPPASAAPAPRSPSIAGASTTTPGQATRLMAAGLSCHPVTNTDGHTWWRHCTTGTGYRARSVTYCDDGRVLVGPWVGPSSFVWSQSCGGARWDEISFYGEPA